MCFAVQLSQKDMTGSLDQKPRTTNFEQPLKRKLRKLHNLQTDKACLSWKKMSQETTTQDFPSSILSALKKKHVKRDGKM